MESKVWQHIIIKGILLEYKIVCPKKFICLSFVLLLIKLLKDIICLSCISKIFMITYIESIHVHNFEPSPIIAVQLCLRLISDVVKGLFIYL